MCTDMIGGGVAIGQFTVNTCFLICCRVGCFTKERSFWIFGQATWSVVLNKAGQLFCVCVVANSMVKAVQV